MIQYICACMLSRSNCVRLCVTQWTVACLLDSSVHGILQARILKWVSMPSSRGIFPTQGSNSCLLRLLHCRQILYCWTTREALQNDHHNKSSSHLSVTKVIKKFSFLVRRTFKSDSLSSFLSCILELGGGGEECEEDVWVVFCLQAIILEQEGRERIPREDWLQGKLAAWISV